jgi:ribonuclease HI
MAIGVVSIMLIMGLFSPNKAHAAAPVVGTVLATPSNPGATTTIKIPFTVDVDVAGNSGEIWVAFDKLYGVPTDIEKSAVSITTGQSTGGVSNPLLAPTVAAQTVAASPLGIDDTVVKLQIGDTVPNSTSTVENIEAGGADGSGTASATHYITFSSAAGITMPTGSSTTANQIRLSQDSGANWSTVVDVDTARELSLSATSGARGKVVTVTGKGFSGTGEATVWIDDNDGSVESGEFIIESGIEVSGGTFEVEFTTDVNYAVGAVYINAVDGTGSAPSTVPTFTTYGAVSTDLDSVARGSNLKISLAQWTSGDTITKVSFGASTNTVTADVAGNTTVPKTLSGTSGSFYVKVPVGTPLGSQKVTVTGTTEGGSPTVARYTTVEVTGAPVTVTPSTGVDGQEVTISGSGFTAGSSISTVSVGGVTVTYLSSGGLATTNAVTGVTADNSGNLTASFLLPNDAVLRTAGDHKIIITDSGSRTGEVMVTVPGRTLALDKDESKRGSTVNATGTGFKAKASITIAYTNSGSNTAVTVGTATADALGNWTGSFVVPSTASIPSTNTVTATAASGSSKTATHKLPGASVSSDLTSQSTGDNFTLSGDSFPSYVSVTTLTVGGIDAKPSPAPASDGDGNFTATVMVPGLTTGTHAISVTAGSVTASTSIEVVSTIAAVASASTATADVFADSIAADNLVRVWKFDNSDQSWSFYDPRDAFADANTLANTATGDIVWVNVTAEETFQGGTLFPGWNLISLD